MSVFGSRRTATRDERCPSCRKRALQWHADEKDLRLVCTNCGRVVSREEWPPSHVGDKP